MDEFEALRMERTGMRWRDFAEPPQAGAAPAGTTRGSEQEIERHPGSLQVQGDSYNAT
ncbi:hypothetical protein [Dokdonella soli]|uniref:Uncharacterized protein n=1 Tax=Dokdonella soli TaxID=529810 RepID=A0ABN1IHI3_9GAMM